MSDNMFSNINYLKKSLDTSWIRNNVYSNNIANVDTPGYKRKRVEFENMLQKVLNKEGKMSINSIDPIIVEDNTTSSFRIDGNNVDPEVEMVELAKNQIKYNSLINQVSYEFKMLKTVINSK